MDIDQKTMKHIADLAKLMLTNQEASQLAEEFNHILSELKGIQAEQANQPDTSRIQPNMQYLRKDEIKPFTDRKALFQNTRLEQDGHIAVPTIPELE